MTVSSSTNGTRFRRSLMLLPLMVVLAPRFIGAQEPESSMFIEPKAAVSEAQAAVPTPSAPPRAPYRKARSQVQIAAPELEEAERLKEYGTDDGSTSPAEDELEDVFGQ